MKITKKESEKYAKKYKIDTSVISLDSFRKGMEVELEHINRVWNKEEKKTKQQYLDIVSKIAIDHLLEYPDYYERLEKMEKEAKIEWNGKEKPCIFKGMTYKCTKDDEEDNMNSLLPLEMYVDPDSDQFFDGCQKLLIEKHNAYDLVLIENASEIAKDDILQPNLENIMKKICEEFDDCVYLDSDTFALDKYDRFVNYNYVKDYAKRHNKKLKCKGKYIMTVLAIDLTTYDPNNPDKEVMSQGGHYGGFIKHPNGTLYVYDSMKSSLYSDKFEEIGKTIFSPKLIAINACINPRTFLQPTGGFPNEMDPMTKKAFRNYVFDNGINPDHPNTLIQAQALKIQVPESQDHFCFIWSLWLICANLMNADVNFIAQQNLVPLLVIKRFIWTLINMLGIRNAKDIYRQQLYDEYFPQAWLRTSNNLVDTSSFAPFRYTDNSISTSSIRECMEYSVSKPVLVKLPRQQPPQDVLDALVTVPDYCDVTTNF